MNHRAPGSPASGGEHPPRLALSWVPLLLAAALLGAAGCKHAPDHEKVKAYDAQLSTRLGKARQSEILTLLGEPQVRDLIGDSEVWMYQFEHTGEPVRGRPEVALVAPDHDEIMISFDREGTMQSYHVIIEGRKSRRGRNP